MGSPLAARVVVTLVIAAGLAAVGTANNLAVWGCHGEGSTARMTGDTMSVPLSSHGFP